MSTKLTRRERLVLVDIRLYSHGVGYHCTWSSQVRRRLQNHGFVDNGDHLARYRITDAGRAFLDRNP